MVMIPNDEGVPVRLDENDVAILNNIESGNDGVYRAAFGYEAAIIDENGQLIVMRFPTRQSALKWRCEKLMAIYGERLKALGFKKAVSHIETVCADCIDQSKPDD